MSLRKKTISGFAWSFIDSFANQGLSFFIGIILARLLSPEEFGLIGMLAIFMAISQSFIDSGFGSALIRKKDCTAEDYSTVFYYNLVVGIILYLVLFFSAQAISSFFAKPQLKIMVQVLGINLIINSVSLIQKTILIKNINFKLQAKISIISSIISGSISIGMAFGGWGVWSLVLRLVIQNLCMSILLWAWNTWRPRIIFSIASFKELFGFGSRLMFSGLIDTTYNNIYYLIIGKEFSANELGFFTRAQNFSMLPTQLLTEVIQRVSYPALSTLQDSQDRLKAAYRKLIKNTMLISFVLMIGLAAIAKSLVITLIGEKWASSIIYLQLLCFVAVLYPLHALNLNMLNVKGRSDLFLRLEIIKKILVIPTIIIGIFLGIKIMIIGMIVNSIIAYFLNSFWAGKMVNYPFKEQISDITPSFLIASIIGLSVYCIGFLLPIQPAFALVIEISLGVIFFWIATKITKIDSFVEMKGIIKEKLLFGFQGGLVNG
jgi:O-antigen/teichoic acid export membrane protein